MQQLSAERVKDAEALLIAAQTSGAYYLAGYAVECALKACIAKRTNQYDFPDKKYAMECYTHNLEDLVKSSGLFTQLKIDMKLNAGLETNWLTVKDWSESSRYEITSDSKAQTMVGAVTEPSNGVLQWIMVHW